MIRSYRNIAKSNNLIALGGGLSQIKEQKIMVSFVKMGFMKSFKSDIKLKRVEYLGGF